MPFAEIHPGKIYGGTIYYADHRKPDSAYTPVIFIHGAGGSHLDWSAQLRRLPQANAIVPDLPGHGKSKGDGRDSMADYAADISGLLDALELERAIFAGHSMGGGIVQTLALNFPERVKALILMGTGAKLRVHPDILNQILIAQSEVGELFKEWFWAPSAPSPMREASYQQFMNTPVSITYNDYIACDNFDVRARLHEITQRALVIGGTHDRMTPLKYSEYLVENLPDAELFVVQDAGHMMALEKPELVASKVAEWLEKLA